MRTEFCCDSIVHYDGYKKPKGRNAMTGIRSMVAAATGFALLAGTAHAADPFTLTSSSFKDGTLLPKKARRRQQSQPELRGRELVAAIQLVKSHRPGL